MPRDTLFLPSRPAPRIARSRPPRFGSVLALWLHRARTRRELMGLTAEMLDDIGLTPEEAAREAAKPFWRA